MNEYLTDATTATFTVEEVNDGRYDPSHPDSEANLNIQYVEVMAYRPRTSSTALVVSHGSHLAATNQPLAICASSGSSTCSTSRTSRRRLARRMAQEKLLPLEYATALCNLSAQLGARGVSVLSRTATTVSAMWTAKPRMEESISSLCSLHLVRVVL